MALSPSSVRNAGGVPFLVLRGHFVVRAKQMPDGDTVAFAASAKYKAGPVKTNVPVNTTGDKTANLRLQSIDAPEKAQPMGAKSRNGLLTYLGFDLAALGLTDDDFTADGETQRIPGWLATHGMDGNQRPLSYLFLTNPGFAHGAIVSAAQVRAKLKLSANYRQVAKGFAFPAFYENTDETHAVLFQDAAEKARAKRLGVWSADKTASGFTPTPAALAKGGALVYPKFYRRVAKWKTAKPSSSAFINWLKQQADGKKLVYGAQRDPIRLWQLFEPARAAKVKVPYDVTRLWFSE
jgi:endonuclease YncB( thermonuclease family)